MKTASPYKDKHGKVIRHGDYTRKHTVVDYPKHEYWLYEQVRFYMNDWYLFDVNYDYEKGDDTPHLLSKYHTELEVIDESHIEEKQE